jgi:hypothetical protein
MPFLQGHAVSPVFEPAAIMPLTFFRASYFFH